MENPHVDSVSTYFNLEMFSSTIDYRWRVQRFPQDLNRLLPFIPLDCFTIHFKTILIQFLCVFGFRSPVYPAMARILHWQTARSKSLNEGMLILSHLELSALPYVAQPLLSVGCQNIDYITCTKSSGGLTVR